MNVKVSKSKIKGAGKGLFTNQAFKKGELIGLAHKNGQPVGDIGKMHNHSEDPTAFSVKFGNKRFIYANKDLKPGEEITTDYRMQPELEQPDDFKKGGSIPKMPKKKNAKAYSRSLEATNRLFTQNPLFEQPKSRKNKIYDPKSKYYQDGGTTELTPEEEAQFQKFYNTLPENLQTDDSTYDIRGYWDSEGRPEAFDYSQPKEKDGYYHAYSINSNTGEYLKSPAHETFQHAVDQDRRIGYRPISNVYGRNIATYNPAIIEPTPTTFLTNTEGPIAYKKGGSKLGPISLNSGRYAAKKYPFGKFSGVFKKQNGGEPTSPEEWAEAIKAIEREIGNPDNWTYDDLSKLQGKLYEYKAWREQHPEVIDTHNKPFEYEVPLPKQLNPAAVLQEGGESGYIEVELTPEEIEEYKKGGYIVEDISIPTLNRFQFGGGREARKLKRAQRRAGEPIQGYAADPIFDITTELGFKRQQLLNQSLGRPEIQADPWDQQRWLMEQNMADEEAGLYEAPPLPEEEEVESEPSYAAVEQIDYGPVPEGVPKTTEEYKEFIKPETTTFKDLSRPSSEIILKREMSDELANALKEGGYYINQLYTGDYEVFANKDIADLIYKKGITSTQLSDKFNLGDPKTLQKYFEPVYNSAKSIHAKRNVEKIDNLIGKGYSKDQAIKELVKQGEGTIEGLTADYGGYADATYKKYKAEADALTTLGITDISNLTDYQKKQLLNVATVKSDAETKLDKAQADAAFLNTYMPEVGESTAYRGIIGVDANGQAVYGTTAYDKTQNELAATREMTDLYNATSAQIETGKAILTSPNLTDEQRKQFMENPDKFNEIYQSYVAWMNAPEGEPNYGPGNDLSQRYKYYGDAYTRFIPGSLKSDFTINPDGTTSWHEGTYEQTVTIDGPVQMLYPEQYVIGGGGGLVGGAFRGISRILAYTPVASVPWLNLGSALEADMAYQAFKDEGFVDQAIQDFKEGNYLEGSFNAALGALGLIGPLRLTAGLNARTAKTINALKSDAEFAESFANTARTQSADGTVFYQGSTGGTDASKLLTEASQSVLPVSNIFEETSLLTNMSGPRALDDLAKYEAEVTGQAEVIDYANEINNLELQIAKLRNQEIANENTRQALWNEYKAGNITAEEYKVKATQLFESQGGIDNPRFALEKQVRELKVKKDIANAPQENILQSRSQLGKDISDGGSNTKGVYEVGDNYVARESAHGYDDASRLLLYKDKITSPRIAKTLQVTELDGKVYQVQEKVTGKSLTSLTEEELASIPEEHINNFWKDKAELDNLGLSIDVSGGKSNIFYDPDKGFQFIDLGISEATEAEAILEAYPFLKPSNISGVTSEAEAVIAGKMPQASVDAGAGTRDFYKDYVYDANNKLISSFEPEELFTNLASNPSAEIVDVRNVILPENYMSQADLLSAQEEALNFGANVADRWTLADKEKYFALREEGEQIIKKQVKDLVNKKTLLVSDEGPKIYNKLRDEFLQSKGLLEKFRANPFDPSIPPQTFYDLEAFIAKNPEVIKLNEEINALNTAIADAEIAGNAKILEAEQYVDPIFKQKVQDMYTQAGKTMPGNSNIPRSNAKLVQYDELDPSFAALPKETQEFLKRMQPQGVHLASGDTITAGSYTAKDPMYYLSETSEGEKEILRVIKQEFVSPTKVENIAAHEGRHSTQDAYKWLELVNKYNPEYKYYTTTTENELAKEFNKWLVNPKLANEPGAYAYSEGYTYDTWLSSVGELDSQLMTARADVVKDWMQKYGFSMDEAVQMVKEQELLGDKSLYEFYLNNPEANLNYHFKPDTPFDIKKKLLQILPAATILVGSGAALRAAGSSGQTKNKKGGTVSRMNKSRLKTSNFSFGKKDYAKGGTIELELTPKEIEEYKSKGYIVEEY